MQTTFNGGNVILTQLELKNTIWSLLNKYHAEAAILFGSYARGEADGQSDIDLIVIGGALFEPTDVFCLADELNRMSGKAVDVYELCEVEQTSEFYKAILRDGVHIAA